MNGRPGQSSLQVALTYAARICDNTSMRLKGVTLLVMIVISGCHPAEPLRAPDLAPHQPHLSVVTYNVNFDLAQPDNITDFLAGCDASVVCLQETHARWEAVLKAALEETYPHSTFHEWGQAGGLAVMSRCPLRSVRVLEPRAGWWPALLVEVETPLGSVQVLNVHLKPPLAADGCITVGAYCRAPDVHLREVCEFLRDVDRSGPLIVAGDFNENETGKAVRWLLDQGFTDALSAYDRRSKTWRWRTLLGIILNDRFDHILFNGALDCTGAVVEHVKASDHMPVRAVLVEARSTAVARD